MSPCHPQANILFVIDERVFTDVGDDKSYSISRTMIQVKMMTTDSSAGIYEKAVFHMNLQHDPDHVLDGMLVLRCFFCRRFKTPIEFDIRIHLREIHREELATDLPLKGKGFDMIYRVGFAIDIMKRDSVQQVSIGSVLCRIICSFYRCEKADLQVSCYNELHFYTLC
jgi:hypothetical protein